jgi:hypothetical protein
MAKRKDGLPSNKVAEYVEFDSSGNIKVGMAQFIESSGNGIKVHAVHRDRVLGVQQVRRQAEILMMAAAHAERLGCPTVLME